MDFAVLADNRVKLKESEKKDKYIDLARVLTKPRNMKMTVLPIVIGGLGTFTKGLIKGQEDLGERCPRGAMVKAMDCGIVVSEFVLQFTFGQIHLGKV